MATDTGDAVSPHVRGVTVTTIATVFGVLAGLVSALVTASATDTIGLTVVLGSILVQFPLLHVLGIDVTEFSTKDKIYVAFMTVVMWFIAWGILLTAGTFQ
ncbi:hypothetical protein ACKVMT_16375 [Halobacteriales archaeon Cl-PHB]